jgi:hypothetical protein
VNKKLESSKGIARGCGQYYIICGAMVNMSQSMSTGNLRIHIQRRHKDVYETCIVAWGLVPDRPSLVASMTKISSAFSKTISKEDSQKIIVDACSRFIVAKSLPYDTTKHPEFRRLLNKAANLGKQCPL